MGKLEVNLTFRLLILSVGNFFSGICVEEFFSSSKIPLSVCARGGIFKAWWNFSPSYFPLSILAFGRIVLGGIFQF